VQCDFGNWGHVDNSILHFEGRNKLGNRVVIGDSMNFELRSERRLGGPRDMKEMLKLESELRAESMKGPRLPDA